MFLKFLFQFKQKNKCYLCHPGIGGKVWLAFITVSWQSPNKRCKAFSLGSNYLEEGMATHSNILAWRIQWTEKPGGLQSIGLQRVRQDWGNIAYTHAKVNPNSSIISHISYFKGEALGKLCLSGFNATLIPTDGNEELDSYKWMKNPVYALQWFTNVFVFFKQLNF